MDVKTLIEYLEDMNPDAEVKLAIQPTWAFQHSISEVISTSTSTDLQWGVQIRYTDGTDEEFAESECNTESSATDLYYELSHPADRMKANGILGVYIAAKHEGETVDQDAAHEIEADQPTVVYISEGGQDCYLPEAAAEALGWTRS